VGKEIAPPAFAWRSFCALFPLERTVAMNIKQQLRRLNLFGFSACLRIPDAV